MFLVPSACVHTAPHTDSPVFILSLPPQLPCLLCRCLSFLGTLLGAIREKKLLAHEFDLDLAAREEDCEHIITSLKDKLNAEGYPTYVRGEWIEQKYK